MLVVSTLNRTMRGVHLPYRNWQVKAALMAAGQPYVVRGDEFKKSVSVLQGVFYRPLTDTATSRTCPFQRAVIARYRLVGPS